VLSALDFSIDKTTILSFLSFYSRIGRLDDRDSSLAQYVCELSLLESPFNRYKASKLAVSAVYLINKIRGHPRECNQALLEATCHSEADARACAKALC
jgi:hypothetical protein